MLRQVAAGSNLPIMKLETSYEYSREAHRTPGHTN